MAVLRSRPRRWARSSSFWSTLATKRSEMRTRSASIEERLSIKDAQGVRCQSTRASSRRGIGLRESGQRQHYEGYLLESGGADRTGATGATGARVLADMKTALPNQQSISSREMASRRIAARNTTALFLQRPSGIIKDRCGAIAAYVNN